MKITITEDGREYTWHGALGAVWKSRERAWCGDIRRIAGSLCYVFAIGPAPFRWAMGLPEVSWVPVPDQSGKHLMPEDIRAILAQVVGLSY